MRGRYGRYAVLAFAMTVESSIACRQLPKTTIGFSSAPPPIASAPRSPPRPRPVPNASPRPSIRQAGRDDGTRGDWRRDSNDERRRAIAGRWAELGRNAIGQLGRYGSSRTMATQQNGQRGGKPHVVTIITGYFFLIVYVLAQKLHETVFTGIYVASIIAFPH